MKLTKSALITALVMTLGSWAPVRGGVIDNPEDLGTLGGSISAANGIAVNSNVVVGSSTITGDTATHAVIWAVGNVLDLGVLSGGTNSSASGAASNQRASGASDFDDPVNGVVPHAFLFADNKMQDLGTLGGSQSQGNAINEFSAVAGYSFTDSDAATHAFVSNPFKGNTLIDLGTLGGANSEAFAINNFGLVAGTSQTTTTDEYGNQVSDAVIWNALTSKAQNLGGLGGNYAQANAINDCGAVTGWAKLEGAFLGDPTAASHAVVGSGGKLKDIGTLGGSYAQGNAINDFGVVVGYSNTTGDGAVAAFVWTANKGMVDLNTLLPPNSPWVLIVASGVNNRGEIVGYGTFNGEYHAFLWRLEQFAQRGGNQCSCR
ncbi:MAG: DUF3466 family protein [Acidobacteriaceae bacterium]|nr:DUF3466 family protein [Acidobacteriaceae bacterium]